MDSLIRLTPIRGDIGDEVFTTDEQGPLYDVPPAEDKPEAGEQGAGGGEGLTLGVDVKARGEASEGSLSPQSEGDKGHADLTLVECDIYDSADRYDPNKDDEDGMYEIPDSPGTIRARRSMARYSALRPNSGVCENIPMPERARSDTSDSGSDQDSDFEDMWNRPVSDTHLGDGLDPPPLPSVLPDTDDYYLSPECHKHCPPGPDWKPFHEYDPVYVPHSDPAAMNQRVDNQNYVRGRQRSDSRVTNPYEEIQFGGIYDTVDDDDDDDDVNNRDNNASQDPSRRVNPIQLPPRMPPSPPPPLVPRRIRPISGVADIGRRNLKLPPEPPESVPGHEPRYSGLIMDDVSDPEDNTPHEYTPLEYTRLRSVGSGPLVGDDDIKPMDDTDSETYTKYNPKTQTTTESTEDTSPATVPDAVINNKTNSDNTANIKYDPTPTLADSDRGDSDSPDKAGILFSQGNSAVIVNGDHAGDSGESSEDSDDSYEPFDFNPQDCHQ